MMRSVCRKIVLTLVVAGLMTQSPRIVVAAAEADNSREFVREVAERVDKFVAEVTNRDPELAQEIERQHDVVSRDLKDGRLDNQELVRDIESFREVQREVFERSFGAGEMARLMEGPAGGMPEFGGNPGEVTPEMRSHFEQEYQRVVASGDTEHAEMMRAGFEAFERGETFRPTPEMVERMQGEMERFLAERPEMAEYAHLEMERFAGPDSHEIGLEPREAFERWASEGQHSPEELARAENMLREFESRGPEAFREMDPREFEHFQDMEHEFYREFEVYRELEREYQERLDQRAEFFSSLPPPGAPEPTAASLERTEFVNHFADHNADNILENHVHEVHVHADGLRHDHTDGTFNQPAPPH